MSGTKVGGTQAAQTNKAVHGEDFYKRIGAIGGSVSHPETRPFHVRPDLARLAGMNGGRKSKRNRGNPDQRKAWADRMHAAKREHAAARVQAHISIPMPDPKPKRGLLSWFKGDRT